MKLSAKLRKLLAEVPPENKHHFMATLHEYASTGDPGALLKYHRIPVDPETFIRDPYYMGAISTITGHLDEHGRPEYQQTHITPLYPEVLKHFIEICSHTSPFLPRPEAPDFPVIEELVATGGIGSGKSTLALYVTGYHFYLLTCLTNPQQYYGLDPASELLVVFQAPSGDIAHSGDYARFMAMINGSRYFQENFIPEQRLGGTSLGKAGSIEFPNRIVVKAVSSMETAAIGANVIMAFMEEVNFMGHRTGHDGVVTDHAQVLYEALATRRRTRFTRKATLASGKTISYVPGVLSIVSSRVYPGQFTDLKEAEAKTEKRIYVYDKRVWEVKPDSYSGGTFRVFCGDQTRSPRVLEPHEVVPIDDTPLVDTVPSEYLQSFDGPRADIVKALRNICGRSVLATFPFMSNRAAIASNFGLRQSALTLDTVDFRSTQPAARPKLLKLRPECPRWVHVDLAINNDSCGLVIGHVPGFKEVLYDPMATLPDENLAISFSRKGGVKVAAMTAKQQAAMHSSAEDAPPPKKAINLPAGHINSEYLPIIEIDVALEIKAPKGSEIVFGRVRELLYKLRDLGLPIRWVTLDGFQSRDFYQVLVQNGFMAGFQSIDKTNDPYYELKAALYDQRVVAPKHDKLGKELLALEKDQKKGIIDHPVRGSKDISDALAGVVYGLSRRLEIWNQYKIPLNPQMKARPTKDNMKSEL